MTLEAMQDSWESNSRITSALYVAHEYYVVNSLQHLQRQQIHYFRSQSTAFSENIMTKYISLLGS